MIESKRPVVDFKKIVLDTELIIRDSSLRNKKHSATPIDT
jgi:hypothetical protein